jgi:hypothetical protein
MSKAICGDPYNQDPDIASPIRAPLATACDRELFYAWAIMEELHVLSY